MKNFSLLAMQFFIIVFIVENAKSHYGCFAY